MAMSTMVEEEATVTDINTGEQVHQVDPVEVGDSLLMNASKVHLPIEEGIPIDVWLASAESIKAAAKGSQWWAGDWAVYGEDHWPEEHAAAFDPEKDDIDALANWKWVSRGYEPEDRFEDLTWTHHRIALKIGNKRDRTKLLNLAIKNGLATRDFEQMVKLQIEGGLADQSDTSKSNSKEKDRAQFAIYFTVSREEEEEATGVQVEIMNRLSRMLGKAGLDPSSVTSNVVYKASAAAE